MKSSRRSFIKVAGITALGLGTQPLSQAVAASNAHGPQTAVRKGPKALEAKQWAMVNTTYVFRYSICTSPLFIGP